MKSTSKILISSISLLAIFSANTVAADAANKPKAAGRTAASIPNTILSGVGAPSNSIGIDGDFYIDVKNSNIYGPKIKKKWPAAVSFKGTNGAPGSDGRSGSDGKTITNASTLAGPKGDQGEKGEAGDIGPKGDQGLRGEVGETGPQGIPGVAGAQGLIGLTGATGLQGPAGAGAQGAPGATGSTGAQGPAGATGPQGPSGSGATGAQGPAGPTGATGAVGSVGAQGPAGAAGATGATGLTGSTGPTGATGAQGLQGENGFSQASWTSLTTWSLTAASPGSFSESASFGSLMSGKSYVVNIAIHGVTTKTSGVFSAELITSSTPTYFVLDQSVGEANIYNGSSSSHTYSFNLHGLITVGAGVTSFIVRVTDGGGHTGVQPMTLNGKASFVMVGSIA